MITAIRDLIARFRASVKARDLDRDFEQEWQSHVDMLTDDNVRRGMTHGEARRAALIRVGAGGVVAFQFRVIGASPRRNRCLWRAQPSR